MYMYITIYLKVVLLVGKITPTPKKKPSKINSYSNKIIYPCSGDSNYYTYKVNIF